MYVKVKRRLHVFSLRSNALRDRFALDLKCARAFRVQRAQELREWQCKIGAVAIVVAEGMCSCFIDASAHDNDSYSYGCRFRHCRAVA